MLSANRVLHLLFPSGFFSLLFLLWLPWLGLPKLCYIIVARMGTVVLFLILEEMLSVFHHWECLLWVCRTEAMYFFENKKHCYWLKEHSSVQYSSVAQSCPTLCYPMNRSTPGLPVHHQLPEFTQTHVHPVSDAIQPSHPLSSPSLPARSPSQHQGLFQWVNSFHQVAKVLEFQLPHQSF